MPGDGMLYVLAGNRGVHIHKGERQAESQQAQQQTQCHVLEPAGNL